MNKTGKIQEVKQVDPDVIYKRSLTHTLLRAVSDDDMNEVGKALVTRAKSGEAKAVSLLIKLTEAADSGTVNGSAEKMAEPTALMVRTLAALAMIVRGEMGLLAIASLCNMTEDNAADMLRRSPWFCFTGKGYNITPEGKRAVS